jgi:predicted transcriptional regulator
VLYDNGEGAAQDYVKAREWYEKAAAEGSADAMCNLGVLYDNGEGVVRDYVKAREWYEKAAAEGSADASRAMSYQLGSSDPKRSTIHGPPAFAPAFLPRVGLPWHKISLIRKFFERQPWRDPIALGA